MYKSDYAYFKWGQGGIVPLIYGGQEYRNHKGECILRLDLGVDGQV